MNNNEKLTKMTRACAALNAVTLKNDNHFYIKGAGFLPLGRFKCMFPSDTYGFIILLETREGMRRLPVSIGATQGFTDGNIYFLDHDGREIGRIVFKNKQDLKREEFRFLSGDHYDFLGDWKEEMKEIVKAVHQG